MLITTPLCRKLNAGPFGSRPRAFWEPVTRRRLDKERKKEAANGLVLKRHQERRRSFPTHPAGHLLRRTPDREGASGYGREGVRCGVEEGLQHAPAPDQGADQT